MVLMKGLTATIYRSILMNSFTEIEHRLKLRETFCTRTNIVLSAKEKKKKQTQIM